MFIDQSDINLVLESLLVFCPGNLYIHMCVNLASHTLIYLFWLFFFIIIASIILNSQSVSRAICNPEIPFVMAVLLKCPAILFCELFFTRASS